MRVGFVLCAVLAGCTVGPNFKPPKPQMPAAWHNAAQNVSAADPDPDWWLGFHDPTLSWVVNQAIAGNPDFQTSLLRVVEAHENAVATRAAALPSLSANASYAREQMGLRSLADTLQVPQKLDQLAAPDSRYNQLSPGLGTATAGQINELLTELEAPTDMYQYGASASWELDLFGRVRRQTEAANATAAAQADAAKDALVMLEAQAGQAYLQLRAAQALADAQHQTIQSSKETLALTRQRYGLGLASDLDVDQAQTQLADDEGQLSAFAKQAQQAMDQLDTLTGAAPGTLDNMLSKPAPLPAVPGLIGTGVPADLARRRPDIREAEAQLHAMTAQVGVAVAAFYPDISLSGNIGLKAYQASLLTNWASLFFSTGPNISLPIFQGGRLVANLRLAHAREAEAALNYRATVLRALREVEDALTAYANDRTARNQTRVTVQLAARTLSLADTRYALGLASLLQVLDAQRTLAQARQQLTQDQFMLANDAVTLFTALGGGWRQNVAPLPHPKISAPLPPMPAAVDAAAGDR